MNQISKERNLWIMRENIQKCFLLKKDIVQFAMLNNHSVQNIAEIAIDVLLDMIIIVLGLGIASVKEIIFGFIGTWYSKLQKLFWVKSR